MVDRLNVVLVSRSGLGGKSEDMIEAIVGNLAGRAGIDLVLVSPLAEIDEGSTDQLTLMSIAAGAAVLTWTSPEQTMLDLGRVGFTGIRAPHAGDRLPSSTDFADTTPVAGRKVYAMDLRDFASVDDLIDQLDRLRTVQSVKTFSLGAPATPSNRSEKLAVSAPPLPRIIPDSDDDARSLSGQITDDLASNDRPPLSIGDAGLDDLLDQLDDFDV